MWEKKLFQNFPTFRNYSQMKKQLQSFENNFISHRLILPQIKK